MSVDFKKKFELLVERAEAQVEKWKVSFEKDPCHSLIWSQTVFQEAAASRVFSAVLAGINRHIEKDGELTDEARKDLIDFLLREVLRRSGNPSFSTSTTSNLYETYETKAYSEAIEHLKRDW